LTANDARSRSRGHQAAASSANWIACGHFNHKKQDYYLSVRTIGHTICTEDKTWQRLFLFPILDAYFHPAAIRLEKEIACQK
jgi:hypothetical protein